MPLPNVPPNLSREEKRQLTKELGLEAFHRFLKFALKSEHLHYGRFEPDIPAEFANFGKAQDRYLQRLVEIIPAGVKTVLDVGCGSGKTVEHLIEKGYAVDCVSPGTVLTAIVAERLAGRAQIYRGKFEDVAIPAHYDLVLFSESLQYVPLPLALQKSISLLNPGGHILVSDFFHRDLAGDTPIRGGHSYARWRETYSVFPLEILVEQDITAETAPLYDIATAFTQGVVKPTWDTGFMAASMRWPILTKIGRWVLRKQIEKMEKYRLSSSRNAAEFRRAKIYKVYLFRLRGAPAR